MKDKQYKIAGKVYTIGPVTNRQVRELMSLLKDIDVDDKSSFTSLVEKISKESLPEIMSVILADPQAKEIDWDAESFDVTDEIIESFFDKSPRLKRRLTQLSGILTSIMMPEIKSPGNMPTS